MLIKINVKLNKWNITMEKLSIKTKQNRKNITPPVFEPATWQPQVEQL